MVALKFQGGKVGSPLPSFNLNSWSSDIIIEITYAGQNGSDRILNSNQKGVVEISLAGGKGDKYTSFMCYGSTDTSTLIFPAGSSECAKVNESWIDHITAGLVYDKYLILFATEPDFSPVAVSIRIQDNNPVQGTYLKYAADEMFKDNFPEPTGTPVTLVPHTTEKPNASKVGIIIVCVLLIVVIFLILWVVYCTPICSDDLDDPPPQNTDCVHLEKSGKGKSQKSATAAKSSASGKTNASGKSSKSAKSGSGPKSGMAPKSSTGSGSGTAPKSSTGPKSSIDGAKHNSTAGSAKTSFASAKSAGNKSSVQ